MLNLEPIELILRTLPEGFIYMLGVYIFSYKCINKSKYIISSIMSGVSIYIFRALPISYGVHTILTILLIVFLASTYNKIDVILVIKSTIMIFIIQFLSEGLNILLLGLFPSLDLDTMFNIPIYKNLLGIPSLIISLLILIVMKKYIYKKKDNKNE